MAASTRRRRARSATGCGRAASGPSSSTAAPATSASGGEAVEDLVARGAEDRRLNGRVELVGVVELADELLHVELVDGAAQQRRGRERAVDGAVGDRADQRLDERGQIGLVERLGEQLGDLREAAFALEPVDGVAQA